MFEKESAPGCRNIISEYEFGRSDNLLVLGVDPGIATTGWGVVESAGRKLSMVEYGCIITAAGMTQAERLLQLTHGLQEVLDKHRPAVAAVEQLFFNTNVTSAFAVGQARGAILVSLAGQGVVVHEYTPLQVKSSLTGNGRAEKSQVGFMVCALLGLSKVPKPDDAADALAIAICHATHAGSRLQRLSRE